jgi:hypothetical protein
MKIRTNYSVPPLFGAKVFFFWETKSALIVALYGQDSDFFVWAEFLYGED